MVSLIFSPFLLTISMLALLLLGVINWEAGKFKQTIGFNKKLIFRFFQFNYSASFLVVSLYFFIVVFSCWQTDGSWQFWLERIRIKLPFLAMPIAFLGLPRFDKKMVNGILYFLLIFMTIAGIAVGINYGLNFDEINNQISRGKPMPVFRNHIRFSILMSVAIIGGIHLIIDEYFYKKKQESSLIKSMTIFLFLFIHVLSVKTGIVCLYVALGLLSLRYIYLSRSYLAGSLLIIGLLNIPVVAFLTVKSFEQKIRYMHHDLTQYVKGEGGIYSDAGRLTSLKVGKEIFIAAPLFGAGAGNLRAIVHQQYDQHYPEYVEPLMPHNQFLYVLAGTGLFGFSIFIFALFFTLFHKKIYQNHFLFGFYCLIITAFMLEHTIENAVGVATFTFFLCLMLNHLLLPEATNQIT